MEPNKLENQIREKLNSREIKPTEMGWDRLDAMLSVAEQKKTKRSLGWFYIAASILVFLSVGLYFFNQNDVAIGSGNDVVVKDTQNSKDDNTQNGNNNQNNNEINPSVINKQGNQVVQTSNEKQLISNNSQVTIHQQQSSKSFNSINQKTIINPEVTHNSSEALVQVQPSQSNSQEPSSSTKLPVATDEKVLASNDNQLNSSSSSKTKIKVNANSLLSEVDGELETSFRDKVLSKISKNYQNVKTALVNRNLE